MGDLRRGRIGGKENLGGGWGAQRGLSEKLGMRLVVVDVSRMVKGNMGKGKVP